jgi:hypothetical protein
LRPDGQGISHADRITHWNQIRAAHQREVRIKEIDVALDKARGRAKSAFDRVR